MPDQNEILGLQELPEGPQQTGGAAGPDLFGWTSYFSIDSDCIPSLGTTY